MTTLALAPAYRPAADALAGRVVLVTGAGSGLGRESALGAARHGATVVLVGRTPRMLDATADRIEADGGPPPLIHAMDLAGCGVDDYDALAAGIDGELGRIDGIVHAAADFAGLTPIEHFDVVDWARAFQVNVHAPFLLTRALLPLLRRSPAASVLFIDDAVGRRGRAYWGGYAATKAAVANLAEVLADEVGENTAIRVNCLDPGPMRTRLREMAYPGPDPGPARPAEMLAPVVVHLLCDDGRDHHGKRLSVE